MKLLYVRGQWFDPSTAWDLRFSTYATSCRIRDAIVGRWAENPFIKVNLGELVAGRDCGKYALFAWTATSGLACMRQEFPRNPGHCTIASIDVSRCRRGSAQDRRRE